MNRRQFGKASFLGILFAAVVGPISFLTGCGISNIAQAIINSFGKILSFLQSAGILTDPTLVAAAQAALAAFEAAYNAFQTGTGTLEKLAAAAQAALNAVQAFLDATSIGGPIALVVVALAQIILSTLESFLPSPPPAFRIAGKSMTIAPVTRTLAEYKQAWNNECVTLGHKELEIK
jgi:hypothetical protein